MKSRHIWKTATNKNRKSISKIFNDPKFDAKIKDLSKLVSNIERVNSKLKQDKIDNLHEWVLKSIQTMSEELYRQVEETGFIRKLMELVNDVTETNKGDINATSDSKEKTDHS